MTQIAGRRQCFCVAGVTRESGEVPEQSCCRDDIVFPSANATTGYIPGRFGNAAMSKSEDLPERRTIYGSCRRKASQDMGTLYVVA